MLPNIYAVCTMKVKASACIFCQYWLHFNTRFFRFCYQPENILNTCIIKSSLFNYSFESSLCSQCKEINKKVTNTLYRNHSLRWICQKNSRIFHTHTHMHAHIYNSKKLTVPMNLPVITILSLTGHTHPNTVTQYKLDNYNEHTASYL